MLVLIITEGNVSPLRRHDATVVEQLSRLVAEPVAIFTGARLVDQFIIVNTVTFWSVLLRVLFGLALR